MSKANNKDGVFCLTKSTFYSWLKLWNATTVEASSSIISQETLYLKRRVESLENTIKVLKTVDCTVNATLQKKTKSS